ncbi:cell division protein FtsL [Olsenella uli]|uniref:cell division protein FtsL n=1 Tax=Olsenella uli TaxID=133926 RepID=UPI00195E3292|nr:cell division protein FtsL [Olsenella uli]MBM6676849.1 cell division protein FtsL [Olsenella uli]
MRYQGSEAYNMEAAEQRRERLERRAAPSFEVVTGGGLDARARAGVSPTFVARLRAVLVVAAALVALGMVRVGISAATVSLLSSNADLSAQIEESTSLNDQLRVQRSVLSSNARISRIATQNYGMVLTGDAVTIELGSDADAPDGDAAQTPDAAPTQADVS